MNTEQTVNSGSHGVKWGLIIGVVYALFVVLRHSVGAANPFYYTLFAIVGYLVVMGMLFYCGRQLRQQNGGWIEMKEVFKTMFIAVLIFEAFFAVTYFVYLRYGNPGFFDTFRANSENLLIAAKRPQKEIDQLIQTMDASKEQILHATVFDFLKSYLYAVGVTGLFALIFAFILRRQPPVVERDNFFQS
ncbi:DUF4199 domain-containing protein [Flavisolibacter nicotianae]|uniref:DUF4199 domain-containing protein n=1 Tax=Flavisolibacter nicotianae TaxID=2364882 RepID=UPI000EADD3D3|nr:DUF4199 domain-containing protein [Flavisolibacter nicotianae]